MLLGNHHLFSSLQLFCSLPNCTSLMALITTSILPNSAFDQGSYLTSVESYRICPLCLAYLTQCKVCDVAYVLEFYSFLREGIRFCCMYQIFKFITQFQYHSKNACQQVVITSTHVLIDLFSFSMNLSLAIYINGIMQYLVFCSCLLLSIMVKELEEKSLLPRLSLCGSLMEV